VPTKSHYVKLSKRHKVAAAALKLIGGGVLLASFIVQNYLYDGWNSRGEQIRQAILERAIIDKGAQLSEVLFFEAAASVDPSIREGNVSPQKIQEAARKIAMSTSMPVMFNDKLTQDAKIALTNRLIASAANVRDYQTWSDFLRLVNAEYSDYPKEIASQSDELREKRDTARRVFRALYILGSFLLALGIASELRAALADLRDATTT
jgi:hypothetical protein